MTTGQTANAAMAIDLGGEFIKMALIKPGVPMETVLNRDSARKTPMALALNNGERFLGDAALRKAVTRPKSTFTFFVDLAGKQFNDPVVTAYRSNFPYLQLKQNAKYGTVDFGTEIGDLPVETMLGMVLWNARKEVEAYAGQLVHDAVITIPSYFGSAERKAIEAAAKIADINLVQQLGAGTAAGLNYGVFRHKEITDKPQTMLIYDVGATKTLATIVQYKLVTDEANPVPQLETIGVGYDRLLGGIQLTLKLRDHLVSAFRDQFPNSEGDIAQNALAMAKLLKEADRVKQVLSANAETFAYVECVFEDRDFRHKCTRDMLEQLFGGELERRHLAPIDVALRVAEIPLEQVDRVVLMGAGTRVPCLQEALVNYFKDKELGRVLNMDEAIALGAVYQAARVTGKFIVKRFDVKDLLPDDVTAPTANGPAAATEMSEDEIREARNLLADFEKAEKERSERAAALNSLESAVYDYSARLEEDEFSRFGTGDELRQIHEQMAAMKEWLEDVPDECGAIDLKQKRRDLVTPIRKLKNRKRQKEERPKFVEKLAKSVEEAQKQQQQFLAVKDAFTSEELDTFTALATATKQWYEEKMRELDMLEDNQDASFFADDLKAKAVALDREVKTLSSKLSAELKKREEAAKAEAAKKKDESKEQPQTAPAEQNGGDKMEE